MSGICRANFRLVTASLAFAGLLCACATTATPYQPDIGVQTVPGGYSEIRLAPDRYRVTFSAVSTTPRKEIARMAMRRCAELTLAYDHRWFAILDQKLVDGVYVVASPNGKYRVAYEYGYDAWRTYWRLFRYQFGLESVPGDPIWASPKSPRDLKRTEMRIEIELRDAPDDDTIDATEIVRD